MEHNEIMENYMEECRKGAIEVIKSYEAYQMVLLAWSKKTKKEKSVFKNKKEYIEVSMMQYIHLKNTIDFLNTVGVKNV